MSDAVWVFALSALSMASAALCLFNASRGASRWLIALQAYAAGMCGYAAIMWSSL